MEERNQQNIVYVTFVTLAFLAGYTVSVLMNVLAVTSGTFARFMDSDLVRHGVPVAVGLGLFAYLITSAQARAWVEDVISEIGKIVWPSRRDTTAMTIVVSIIIVVAGLFLGAMDWVSNVLIQSILEIKI